MEIPLTFHPAELLRRLSIFSHHFVVDFDLRYPESRKRRLIELALETPDQNLPHDSHLQEFRENRSQVSYLDWPILLEWNERWQQTRTRILVHQAVTDSYYRENSGTSKIIRVILHRLAEIESLVRSTPLPPHPPLVELIRFRWRFSALRDEVDYLIDRLKKSAT